LEELDINGKKINESYRMMMGEHGLDQDQGMWWGLGIEPLMGFTNGGEILY